MNRQRMIKPLLIGVGALVALGLAGLPVLAYLPLLILLACPLMMFFMMRAMNRAGDERAEQQHRHTAGRHDRRTEP